MLSKIYHEFYHYIICIAFEGRHIKIKKYFACLFLIHDCLKCTDTGLEHGCLMDSQGNFLLNSNYRLVTCICLHVLIMNNIIIVQTKF